MPTLFERIANKEIPSHTVYEDDLVIAFLDISQITKGHTLVVPKKAYATILDVPEETLKHLIVVAKKLSQALYKAYALRGLNIINNNGVVAGQSVFHFHLHLIPRYEVSELTFNHRENQTTLAEFQATQALIIEALL